MDETIKSGSCIRFTYKGVERTIDVDNVRQVGRGWNAKQRRYSPTETLVTGWCHTRRTFRSFHRSKMENLVLLTKWWL